MVENSKEIDILKEKEIKIDSMLKGLKSYMMMLVHDEIQIMIHKDELYLIPLIKELLEDVKSLDLPLICSVEKTSRSWADKKGVKVC